MRVLKESSVNFPVRASLPARLALTIFSSSLRPVRRLHTRTGPHAIFSVHGV